MIWSYLAWRFLLEKRDRKITTLFFLWSIDILTVSLWELLLRSLLT